MTIQTHHTAEDITEETLIAHPELRRLVDIFENEGEEPTPTEALLINVIVRQQNAIVAVVEQNVGYLLKHGPLRHDVVA